MLDLDTIDPALMLARGKYATVRSAHEESKKQLAILCGGLSAASAQVLNAMQPKVGEPDMAHVKALVASCRASIDKIDACADEVSALSEQRAALKPIAWPR